MRLSHDQEGRGLIALTVAVLLSLSSSVLLVRASPGVVATISESNAGSYLSGAAYDSGMGEIFVANDLSNTISVIRDSDNAVVATIPVCFYPCGNAPPSNPYSNNLAYDPGKGEVFATNFVSNTTSVIDDVTNTVTAVIRVGHAPYGVAYDSGKDEVFVANDLSNTVSVIRDSDNAVVATIPVGVYPQNMVYNSGKDEVFVSTIHGGVFVIGDITTASTTTSISSSSSQVYVLAAVGVVIIGVVVYYAATHGRSRTPRRRPLMMPFCAHPYLIKQITSHINRLCCVLGT